MTTALVLISLANLAQAPQQKAPDVPLHSEARPEVAIHSAEAGRVKVFYLNIPWGPATFAAMEKGGASFYTKRTWPFARLQSEVPLKLDGTKIAPGNYALVFHPNTEGKGMALEVVKIEVPEFLQPGNAFTPTPPGDSVYKQPISFQTEEGKTSPLDVGLSSEKERLSLTIRYGDRKLVKELVP